MKLFPYTHRRLRWQDPYGPAEQKRWVLRACKPNKRSTRRHRRTHCRCDHSVWSRCRIRCCDLRIVELSFIFLDFIWSSFCSWSWHRDSVKLNSNIQIGVSADISCWLRFFLLLFISAPSLTLSVCLSVPLYLSVRLCLHASSSSLVYSSWLQCSDCGECGFGPIRGGDWQCSRHAHHDRAPWGRRWTAGVALNKVYYCAAVSYSLFFYFTISSSLFLVSLFLSISKASKKGIMEAADMVVVNKADGEIEVSLFGLFVFIWSAIQSFIFFSCRFL